MEEQKAGDSEGLNENQTTPADAANSAETATEFKPLDTEPGVRTQFTISGDELKIAIHCLAFRFGDWMNLQTSTHLMPANPMQFELDGRQLLERLLRFHDSQKFES